MMACLWDDLESVVDLPYTAAAGEKGSIKPADVFNAASDAAALKEAMKGFGTREKILIDILTRRSSAQRQLICEAYEEATGDKLADELEGETYGSMEDLLVALVTPPATYDCHEVIRALKGIGAEESVLTEIFASRNNHQIQALSYVYLQEKGRKLTYDLDKEVSGHFGKALLILAEGKRDEPSKVDPEQAKEDAETLHEAGEKKFGTDECKFIEILCQRSIPQLRLTLLEYKKLFGKTLQKSVEAEMSGDLHDLLLAVLKCVKNEPAYFAECLHEGMKGGGTCEDTLNRIMVSRSEIDMQDIKKEFMKLYGHSLYSFLESEVSGNHGDCLKAICGDD
ncbi:annexin A3a [Aulostomus maculatus]